MRRITPKPRVRQPAGAGPTFSPAGIKISMTPTLGWSIDAVLRHYWDLGRAAAVPWDVLGGGRSHAPKWHAFDITEHVRRTVAIASTIVEAGWACESLIDVAAWHDVGKVIAIQF